MADEDPVAEFAELFVEPPRLMLRYPVQELPLAEGTSQTSEANVDFPPTAGPNEAMTLADAWLHQRYQRVLRVDHKDNPRVVARWDLRPPS